MENLIDFRKIADKYSFAEHAERANRYFATLGLDSSIARKPFASPLEAIELASGVAAILSGLNLFHGAKVLDFGAGTCWLSRTLALMGCEVTATDVSANALRVGQELIAADPLAKHMQVSFAVASEQRLPFPDKSFDRVVVFDAFHHCKDQLAMIGEFYRVLADDGIAAFHEPGPDHSRLGQSQYEMRNFDVIEGDIRVDDLIAEAKRVGFVHANMALYVSRPVLADLPGFNAFLAGGGAGLDDVARRESENRRVFFLYKGSPNALDSRTPAGLACEMNVSAEVTEGGIVLSGLAKNTGPATWLPSGGNVGNVNVGVHLHGPDGAMLENDYARLPLSDEPVAEGESRLISGTIPLPSVDGYRLTVDLVAEGVSWFEVRGSQPVRL